MKKFRKQHVPLRNEAAETNEQTTSQVSAPIPEERIRLRAYELYLARGSAPGRELDDWLLAEWELKAEMGLRQKSPAGPEQGSAAQR